MLNNENSMILELWELMKEYIPEKARGDVAVRYLRIVTDHDISDELGPLRGEDRWLDDALLDYVDGVDEDDDDDYDYDYEDE